MVSGMIDVQASHDGVCPGCATGRKTRRPFPSCKSNNNILQLIQSNLCGPMPLYSLAGYLYYIIFVDHLSKKIWIFYLNHKDEAFYMFKDFKALIENQKGKRIKIFRFNNGGEYTSNVFIEFCKVGIEKETIVPYNLEKNGLDEKK